VRFFELLLDRGADPKLPAKNAGSAVAVAARMGRGDVPDLFASVSEFMSRAHENRPHLPGPTRNRQHGICGRIATCHLG
jgi:hypothetical protein